MELTPGLDLAWPLPVIPRIAVADARLELPQQAKRFRWNEWKTLSAFRPESLAGSSRWIDLLLDRQEAGTLDLTMSLTYPVLVLSKPTTGPAAARLRDRVWDRWGVPVFEQWRDDRGRLLAWECEAHGPLHVSACYEGPALIQAECACGTINVRCVALEYLTPGQRLLTAAAAD